MSLSLDFNGAIPPVHRASEARVADLNVKLRFLFAQRVPGNEVSQIIPVFFRRKQINVLDCFQFIRQLLLANFGQQRAHRRAGLHAQRDQIVAGQQRRADFRLLLPVRAACSTRKS